MVKPHKGQIAIEFVLLLGFGMFFVMVVLLSITIFSVNKTDEKTYYEIDDFGSSLQQEIALASQLEDGYTRKLDLPVTINGREFDITTGNSSLYNSSSNASEYYFTITEKGTDFYYVIPKVNGTLQKGRNIIIKMNNSLYITH